MQTVMTPYGELVPQHTTDSLRKKDILPVTYFENGMPKSVPLERQTTIETPSGPIPAELVTFHENGTVNRIFPLNGKLSGYWNESDEAELATPLTIDTPAGTVSARIISIGFHASGTMRSLTLWPGETVSMATPAGPVDVRIGMSFSPDGTLRSVEPDRPTPVRTPVGEALAYDPDAVGVNGDDNSLKFDSSGTVCGFSTVMTAITATRRDGTSEHYSPTLRESLCGDEETEPCPMRVAFEDGHMIVTASESDSPITIDLDSTTCMTTRVIPEFGTGAPIPRRC